MTNLQILGGGCARCHELAVRVEEAAKSSGVEFVMEHISDLKRIMDFGVMVTPALVVNGKVKVAGRIPSMEELKGMLAEVAET